VEDPGQVSRSSPVSTRQLLVFGFHTSLATSLYAVHGSLVPVVLGRTAGPAAVGLFGIGMLPVTIANTLTGPLRLILYPEQARLAVEGKVKELRRSMFGYTLIGFGLGSIGAAVGWIAMPKLIPLIYSSKFDGAVTPARILLIAAVFQFATSWAKTFPAAIGRPQLRTLVVTVQIVVLGSLLFTVAGHGSEGAALAVSAASVSVGLAWAYLAHRLLNREALVEAHPAPI
jgi:O-antigen/teichoic acid export membrane protein